MPRKSRAGAARQAEELDAALLLLPLVGFCRRRIRASAARSPPSSASCSQAFSHVALINSARNQLDGGARLRREDPG